LFLTYIITYFDTYDCAHNGDEPPKDAVWFTMLTVLQNKWQQMT